MSIFDTPRFSLWLACAVSLFTLLLWIVMPSMPLIHLVEEGGWVENLTLAGYAVAILIFMTLPMPAFKRRTRVAIVIVLLAMMAREADLHKVVADMSMLKLRFWTGSLPISAKLSAILILLPIVIACQYLVGRYWRALRQSVAAAANYALSIATFIGLIVITNIIDRSLGMIKETTGWRAPDWLVALQTSQEEFLELLLPILAIVALIQYRRRIMQFRATQARQPLMH